MTRLGFLMAMGLGHVTYKMNLETHVAHRGDVHGVWLPIGMRADDVWQRVHPFPARVSLRARAAVLQAEKDGPLDALFVHTETMANAMFDVFRRTPTVVSMDSSPLGFRGMANEYGFRPYPRLMDAALDAWSRRVFVAAAHVVMTSEWAKRSLIEDYSVPEAKITVVPLGVDTSYWTPGPARTEDGIVRFVFVGGDFARKGGGLLLRFARETSAKGWEIHVVTRDPVPETPGVFVHRFDNNSAGLLDLVRRCDVSVLPTLADVSSFASLEAMAAGLPVIATHVGGIPELIAEGKTGLLVPPGDFDALHDRMVALLKSPGLRAEMGRAGRARAVALYDVDVNCRRVVDLLKDVAHGKRQPRSTPAVGGLALASEVR
jgi:glycosyltransferase involved in cell wall biosynthesis